MILEIQQTSDITYRLFDYERKDKNGDLRPLHISRSLDVTKVPRIDSPFTCQDLKQEDNSVVTLVENEFFKVTRMKVSGELAAVLDEDYLIGTVTEGHGTLILNDRSYEIAKSDAFILSSGMKGVILKGGLTLIMAENGKDQGDTE